MVNHFGGSNCFACGAAAIMVLANSVCNYAYYTTDDFPYAIACFRGEVNIETPWGAGGPAR